MKKESYIAAMQKINMSDQFVQETVAMLQTKEDHASGSKRNITNNRKLKNTVINRNIYKAAAIIAVILLSTAGITAAAAKLNILDLFKGYFKEQVKPDSNGPVDSQDDQGKAAVTSVPLKEDNKFLEEASAIINSSVTANGLKLTARGVVGDRNTVYIAVDVETVDEGAFSKSQREDVKNLSFSKVWLKTNGNALGQYCYVTRVDDGSVAGRATFVLQNTLDTDEAINHINITFVNLTETNADSLVDIGSQKSLLDIMEELGEASEEDFDYMGARFTDEADRLWYHAAEEKYLSELEKSGAKSNSDYDSYWGKRDAYMEAAILERGGITPKYCIKRTEEQATFSTRYPNLAVSNIGIRSNQLCVKFELNASMNFEKFCDAGIVIVNKKNGDVIGGTVDASQPVNGNDAGQADMADGKIISCGAQFNGIADKEILKDYYFAFGAHSKNTLFEGEWELDFDLAYTDTTREYTVSGNLKIGGTDRKLEKILISPLSLQLKFRKASGSESFDDNRNSLFNSINTAVDRNTIRLIMKDGTEVVLDRQSSEEDSISAVLPVVIDLEEVSAININGTNIELFH
jgi:hypothetical protein